MVYGNNFHANRRGGGNGMMVDDGPSQNNQQAGGKCAVEILNWQGGSQNDLVQFIQRRVSVRLEDVRVSGNVLHAKVPPHALPAMLKSTGLRFAGRSLRITEGRSDQQGTGTKTAIEVLTMFLMSRYDANAKLLNLTNMRGDQLLQENRMFADASTASKMFPALMKVAATKGLNVESVSLEANNLHDLDGVRDLAITYPRLLNLSLAHNQLQGPQALLPFRNKLTKLRELVLMGNPVTNLPSAQHEILQMFPRLVVLDGMQVRDESQLPTNRLPYPIVRSFFETPEIQQMAQSFLGEFFRLWDANRDQLMQLYDELSLFSVCFNSNTPKQPGAAALRNRRTAARHSQNPNGPYVSLSRNLEFSNTAAARHDRIGMGPASIGAMFKKLPQSKHDLSDPNKFAIEAMTISDVRMPGDSAVSISVHGEMQDAGTDTARSFDRTLVVLPTPTGGFVIVSDMLTVRGYAGADAFTSSVPANVAPGQSPGPGTSGPGGPGPAGPGSAGHNLAGPGLTGAPNGLGSPSPGPQNPQEQCVQQLMAQTRLNLEYAQMCSQQANFDLARALQLFEESRAQLPPNAFV